MYEHTFAPRSWPLANDPVHVDVRSGRGVGDGRRQCSVFGIGRRLLLVRRSFGCEIDVLVNGDTLALDGLRVDSVVC